jgi:hypothetical protein
MHKKPDAAASKNNLARLWNGQKAGALNCGIRAMFRGARKLDSKTEYRGDLRPVPSPALSRREADVN